MLPLTILTAFLVSISSLAFLIIIIIYLFFVGICNRFVILMDGILLVLLQFIKYCFLLLLYL